MSELLHPDRFFLIQPFRSDSFAFRSDSFPIFGEGNQSRNLNFFLGKLFETFSSLNLFPN